MKMKNRSHNLNLDMDTQKRPKLRHGHKNRKYRKCLSMMMLICIKQRLSNICSSIQEKVKQH